MYLLWGLFRTSDACEQKYQYDQLLILHPVTKFPLMRARDDGATLMTVSGVYIHILLLLSFLWQQGRLDTSVLDGYSQGRLASVIGNKKVSSGFGFQQAKLHSFTVNYCNVNLVVRAIAAAWQIRALLFISIVAHGVTGQSQRLTHPSVTRLMRRACLTTSKSLSSFKTRGRSVYGGVSCLSTGFPS